jgi:membrane protease YdiL (CAAX protease family)
MRLIAQHVSRLHPHAVLLFLLGFDLVYWLGIFRLLQDGLPAIQSRSIRVVVDAVYALGLLILARSMGTAQTHSTWLKDCGLMQMEPPSLRDIGFVAHAVIVGIGLYMIPWVLLSGGVGSFGDASNAPRAGVPALAILAMPFFEETVFTGFVYASYRSRMGMTLAIVFTTVAKAATHATSLVEFWPGSLTIPLSGIVFCLYREFSGSLLPSIAAHIAFNACFYVVSLPKS